MLLFLMNIYDDEIRHELEEIYELYKKDLLCISNNILRDYHEAENVVQTTILKIADNLDKIKGKNENLRKGYVMLIARNLAINIYKKRKNIAFEIIENYKETLISEVHIDPERNIIQLDNGRYIAKSLAEIRLEYADILTLRFTYDLSNKEIANLLEISDVNVRKRISRAKNALFKVMEGDEVERTS